MPGPARALQTVLVALARGRRDQLQAGTPPRFSLAIAPSLPLPSVFLPPPSMFQTLYSYFWWERLWLPANLTWADLEDRDGRVYAKASDLYITLPLAFLFLVIRHLFET